VKQAIGHSVDSLFTLAQRLHGRIDPVDDSPGSAQSVESMVNRPSSKGLGLVEGHAFFSRPESLGPSPSVIFLVVPPKFGVLASPMK
jgi:hypothetical protein